MHEAGDHHANSVTASGPNDSLDVGKGCGCVHGTVQGMSQERHVIRASLSVGDYQAS